MIQIKKNDYVQPTEVREEVVQAICDAFIYGAEHPTHVDHTYRPFSCGAYRGSTRLVAKPTCRGVVNEFKFIEQGKEYQTDITYRFNGAEMKQAFEELIHAGYYMFVIYTPGKSGMWKGYRCHKKPYAKDWWEGATRVSSFEDFID